MLKQTTLPETNIFAPKHEWLENEQFSFVARPIRKKLILQPLVFNW